MSAFEAPVGSMEGRRRPLRFGHVLVTLEDLLLLTWEVPLPTLRRLLPTGLEPWSRNGMGRASALLFRNRGLRPALVGFPRLSCFQMNLRSYVLDPETGEPGSVFFHGLYLSEAWLARFSAWSLGVPFRALPLHIAVERQEGRLSRWEASAQDSSVAIRAREEATGGDLDPTALDLLTNPHTGYVRRPGSSELAAWSLWHRNQRLRPVAVERVRIRAMEEAGLEVGSLASALLVDSIDYEVYLPARPVSLALKTLRPRHS